MKNIEKHDESRWIMIKGVSPSPDGEAHMERTRGIAKMCDLLRTTLTLFLHTHQIKQPSAPTTASVSMSALAKKCGCLIIISNNFRGYVFVTLSASDAATLAQLNELNHQVLNALEVEDATAQIFSVIIPHVGKSPTPSAFTNADFIISNLSGDEIFGAVYQDASILRTGNHLAERGMASVAIDEVRADAQTDLDLYIHLRVNDKLIRYANSGSIISAERLRRLRDRSIETVYVKKDSLTDLRTKAAVDLFETSSVQ